MNTQICRTLQRVTLDHTLNSVPKNVFEVPFGLSVAYMIHMSHISEIIF